MFVKEGVKIRVRQVDNQTTDAFLVRKLEKRNTQNLDEPKWRKEGSHET